MQVTIRQCPKHIKLKTIRTVIDFCADELLSKRLQEKISVDIIFDSSNLDPGDYGQIGYSVDDHHAEVEIRPSLSRADIICTLAHEMAHVQQYATRRLYDYSDTDFVRWKKRKYRVEDADPDKPWEIEAYRMEEELIDKLFKKHVKKGKT